MTRSQDDDFEEAWQEVSAEDVGPPASVPEIVTPQPITSATCRASAITPSGPSVCPQPIPTSPDQCPPAPTAKELILQRLVHDLDTLLPSNGTASASPSHASSTIDATPPILTRLLPEGTEAKLPGSPTASVPEQAASISGQASHPVLTQPLHEVLGQR